MIENLSMKVNEDQDLHIAKHIDLSDLPAMIQPVMALAQSESERDILLLSIITAAGSCMPNLYCRYGMTGKRYYPNLQCFIVGSAACGKGIANLALEMVQPVHKAVGLVIPGDSSYPGFYRQLERQEGRGYIHESEGSVITDVWRSSVISYNTALRKAAEHEPITRNRAVGSSEISNPRLSMLLTGTFGQYKALVPSVENGYFSRLMTMIVTDHQEFNSRYVEAADERSGVVSVAGEQLYELCAMLYRSKPIEFVLTSEQRARLGHHMENAYPLLIQLLGENFHSVVLRMAVHIERIAMILSALRASEGGYQPSEVSHQMVCSDQDYEIAEMIGNKLIQHMAIAYQMIKGNEQASIPSVQPLDQRKILLNQLPEEFETRMLLEEAKTQGLNERTVYRWKDEWERNGMIQKIRHGVYRKGSASA